MPELKKPDTAPALESPPKLRSFRNMLELSPEEQTKEQLRHLDSLMFHANKDKDYDAALRIVLAARDIMKATPMPRRRT